jgi:hypothetical protein
MSHAEKRCKPKTNNNYMDIENVTTKIGARGFSYIQNDCNSYYQQKTMVIPETFSDLPDYFGQQEAKIQYFSHFPLDVQSLPFISVLLTRMGANNLSI